MIFVPEASDDISRYFRHTYVKFKETGDKLFYIQQVSHNKVVGVDETETVFELWLHHNSPYEVDYVLPHRSYFQYEKYAVFLQRIPAKQYQRGISEGNTQAKALTRTGGTSSRDLTFPLLKAFVEKQQFTSITDAVRNMSKNISTTLSPRFAYVPTTKSIYLDNVAIATVNPAKKTVVPLYTIFRDDLLPLLHNSEYKLV